MSEAQKSKPFIRLSALQGLVANEQRRELGVACAETDLRRHEETLLADAFTKAEANLDAVYGGENLCPVRLRLAAAIVDVGAKALAAGGERLRTAEEAEELAQEKWRIAHYRTRWFADRASTLRKQEADRRDETALSDALSLRLAAGRGTFTIHSIRKVKS